MKHIFIINPTSGKNKKRKVDIKIRQYCEAADIDFELFYTSHKGEAETIVKNLEEREQCIVYAVGGDGTLNEVLNGIMGTNHILSVIPSGSGNDFFKTIKMLNKEYINCDVGRINGRYFINVACIGIDADIAGNVSLVRKCKFIPVSQRYNASIIYTFLKYKFKNLTLKFGGDSLQGKYTIVTICNAQYYGSGYRIAPRAMIDDGMFDIYLVSKMPKIKIIPLLLKLKKAKHEENPKVKRYSDDKLEVVSDKVISCNMDGEEILSKKFEVEMFRNAVTFYYNENLLKELSM